MDFRKIERMVEQILRDIPSTRDDDYELITECYSRTCPSVLDMPFRYVFLGHKTLHIPNFKTIERARRNIQSKYPELVSSKNRDQNRNYHNNYYHYYYHNNYHH